MQYLVKKKNHRKSADLYVADTHSFNLKGKRIVTLTDLKEFAQEFTLKEATEFIEEYPGFTLVEKYESIDWEKPLEEEEEEDDE